MHRTLSATCKAVQTETGWRVAMEVMGETVDGVEQAYFDSLSRYRAHVLFCELAVAIHRIALAHEADETGRKLAAMMYDLRDEVSNTLIDYRPFVTWDRDDILPVENSTRLDDDGMLLWLAEAEAPLWVNVAGALVLMNALNPVLVEIADHIAGDTQDDEDDS